MGAGGGWRRRRGGILVPGPRPAALPALPELGAPRGPGLVPLPPLWPPVSPERPAAALSPGAGERRPWRGGSTTRLACTWPVAAGLHHRAEASAFDAAGTGRATPPGPPLPGAKARAARNA